MSQEFSLAVEGYPPAKNEALSMLGPNHPHAARVVKLLEGARIECERAGFVGFGPRPIGLELVVLCPRDRNRSDATNYPGGIGDVLEAKIDELHATKLTSVSEAGGVYIVWRPTSEAPAFLDANPGGRFKAQDPTVARDALDANWVDTAEVVYIGKANSLKRRLGELERFGGGAPIGHWGGGLIWQLADAVGLRVAWKPTPGLDPKQIESELIAEFRYIYGKSPFANHPHLLGR